MTGDAARLHMGFPHYFRLVALPVLDPPPAAPPLTLRDFFRDLPSGRPRRLAHAILLSDDLLRREAVRAGEVENAEPVVLSEAQLRGDEPLPPELGLPAEPSETPLLAADVLWGAYYRHAASLARAEGSAFLGDWVGWEVAVRNALAIARARLLRLEPRRYTVAWELQRFEGEADAAQAAWSASPDPLSGLQGLIMTSWRWIDQREPWFTFQDDEFAAYAAKLVLLHRWQRSSAGPEGRRARAAAEEVGV